MSLAKNRAQMVKKGEIVNLSYSAIFWKTKESFLIVSLLSCNNPTKHFLTKKSICYFKICWQRNNSSGTMKNHGNSVTKRKMTILQKPKFKSQNTAI